jgi:hypothetical protein
VRYARLQDRDWGRNSEELVVGETIMFHQTAYELLKSFGREEEYERKIIMEI